MDDEEFYTERRQPNYLVKKQNTENWKLGFHGTPLKYAEYLETKRGKAISKFYTDEVLYDAL
jgi:hypothetical protein